MALDRSTEPDGVRRRELYPEIEPYDTGFLDTGEGHQVYWELSGNPQGTPVVFLHGGPGAGSSPHHRRLFNPERYRILIFDQRGCGRSKPHAIAGEQHHLAPRRRYRAAAGDDWRGELGGVRRLMGLHAGARLCADASRAGRALILRGIFRSRRFELEWYYQHGASMFFPESGSASWPLSRPGSGAT